MFKHFTMACILTGSLIFAAGCFKQSESKENQTKSVSPSTIKIDGSSTEAFTSTMTTLQKGMSSDDRAYVQALVVYMGTELIKEHGHTDQVQLEINKKLNGMGHEEVIKYAKEYLDGKVDEDYINQYRI